MRFVALLLPPPLPFNGSNDVVDDDSVATASVFRRRSSWHARRHFRSSISATNTTTTSSSIFSNVWKQVRPSTTMIIITIAIFYGLLLPTTNFYKYCDSSTTTRRGVVYAFRLNHGSHSIGSSRGMNRYHILDDTTTFVPKTLRRHSTPSYHHQQPILRSHSSFTSSILQRYMVNFGPYGDFLNSRVNDNDENNNGNDGLNSNNGNSNNKNQDTQPNPSPTTSKNYILHQSPHHQHHDGGNDDNVVFVYGNDHRMDQFYYYYGCPTETTCTESQMNDSRTPSESTSSDNIHSDDNSSSTNNNTPAPPPAPSQRQWTTSWSSLSSPLLQTQSLDKMDADMAAGTYRILQIPTTSLKPGGLRLFIVMYVLGAIPALMMMHNPNNNPNKLLIWKVDRPSNDEYVIDLYFHDHSAILSIELIPALPPVPKVNDDNEISLSSSSITESTNDATGVPNDPNHTGTGSMIYIHRIGSSPSSMYRMHEATILQGLLQELLTCATDPIIPNVQDRLLTLTNTTIQQLHTICDTFPFG